MGENKSNNIMGYNAKNSPNTQIACRICDHVFMNRQALINHIETHIGDHHDQSNSKRRQYSPFGMNQIPSQYQFANPMPNPNIPFNRPFSQQNSLNIGQLPFINQTVYNHTQLASSSSSSSTLLDIKNPIMGAPPNMMAPPPPPHGMQPPMWHFINNFTFGPNMQQAPNFATTLPMQHRVINGGGDKSEIVTLPLIEQLEKPYVPEVKNEVVEDLDLTLKL